MFMFNSRELPTIYSAEIKETNHAYEKIVSPRKYPVKDRNQSAKRQARNNSTRLGILTRKHANLDVASFRKIFGLSKEQVKQMKGAVQVLHEISLSRELTNS